MNADTSLSEGYCCTHFKMAFSSPVTFLNGGGDFGLLLGVGDDGGCVGEEIGQTGIYN